MGSFDSSESSRPSVASPGVNHAALTAYGLEDMPIEDDNPTLAILLADIQHGLLTDSDHSLANLLTDIQHEPLYDDTDTDTLAVEVIAKRTKITVAICHNRGKLAGELKIELTDNTGRFQDASIVLRIPSVWWKGGGNTVLAFSNCCLTTVLQKRDGPLTTSSFWGTRRQYIRNRLLPKIRTACEEVYKRFLEGYFDVSAIEIDG